MNYAEIGRRVRLRRVQKEWTQQELADEAKVGLGTIQALEDASKKKHPRQTQPINLEKIARALGIAAEALIRGNEPIQPSDPALKDLTDEDLEIAQLYHHARTWKRNLVEELLRANITKESALITLRLARAPSELVRSVNDILDASQNPSDTKNVIVKPK